MEASLVIEKMNRLDLESQYYDEEIIARAARYDDRENALK